MFAVPDEAKEPLFDWTLAALAHDNDHEAQIMPFVWLVECKTCMQRFAVEPREIGSGKSMDISRPDTPPRSFECPHCHESHEYSFADYIPGEGRLH
ncbi:MAG TPA: hypothetical protein VEG32_03785 [Clostridia bacterium]|nr:hypothetical protein [Clostridia bacterium]